MARDLTRRDLKLDPPAGLEPKERQQWLNAKPMEVEVDGRVLTGTDLVRCKYQRFIQDYLACVQGVDDGRAACPSSSLPPSTSPRRCGAEYC